MEYLIGFVIATAVGLTGVGAGSITAPVLILFFHLAPAQSVGTALTFAAVIKFAIFPIYVRRKQVDYRILGLLLAGGIPGVLLGVYLIGTLHTRNYENAIFLLIGSTILLVSLGTLYRSMRNRFVQTSKDRSRWLAPIAAVIGSEVGFSSAGAGAIGSLALLNLSTLTPAQVVGTDMVFGLVLSVIGGGFHVLAGNYDTTILPKLLIGGVAGAFVGANLTAILPARPFKLALAVWLSALGAQLCWKALAF